MHTGDVELPNWIRETYAVEETPKTFELSCQKCPDAWELDKTGISPGGMLALLNHSRSHRGPKRKAKQTLARADGEGKNDCALCESEGAACPHIVP